jgi:glyoxylase-like metal-dependent hydrolase (beta-lactamase superfamily II)
MLQIYLTPHGFLRGALTATSASRTVRGATEVTYSVGGRHPVVGTINARNEVERVHTWVDNPVLGDILYEAVYSGYRDFGGILFPTNIVFRQGGHPVFSIVVATVQANAPVDITTSDAVRTPDSPPRVDVNMVSDGVLYLTGGTHHSVAVEMRDHVVVIEGPLNDERATAVIARVKEAIPGKPIRVVVNTHHHFDHAGGLRAFVDEGATVVTHRLNRPFYERAWGQPRTISPDRLSRSDRPAGFRTVSDRLVLTDGSRVVEVHHLAGNTHDEGLLVAYLPRERILIEADAFTVNVPNAPVPATPNPFSVNLYENIQRLKLQPARILGLHGQATDMAELRRMIQR